MVRGGEREWRKGRLLGATSTFSVEGEGESRRGRAGRGVSGRFPNRTGIYLPSPITSSKHQVPPTHPFLGYVGCHVTGGWPPVTRRQALKPRLSPSLAVVRIQEVYIFSHISFL